MKRLKRRNRTEDQTNQDVKDDQTDKEAPVATKNDDSNLPALQGGFLAQVGEISQNEMTLAEEPALPPYAFLRFYSDRAKNAFDVIEALGRETPDAQPYVTMGGEIIGCQDARIVILNALHYWQTAKDTTGRDYSTEWAWLDRQDFGAKVGAEKVKESVIALCLVFHPEEGVFTALSEVKTTKVPWAKTIMREALKTEQDPTVAAKLGQVMNVAPKLRMPGKIRLKPKNNYVLVDAACSEITRSEMEALADWQTDEEAREQYLAVERLYTKKVDEVKKIADATAKAGITSSK